MKFNVLTLFPEMFSALDESIIGRGKEKGLIDINLINIRDFSKNKHKKGPASQVLDQTKTRRKRKMVCGGFCGLDNLDFHGNGKIKN